MVIANIWLRIAVRSPPAALRLMKAWQPNVDGKRYEKYFQNAGKAAVGQEVPVRKRQIGDMNRNSTKTVSLRVTTVLQVMLKKTQSVTKKSSRTTISQNSPL